MKHQGSDKTKQVCGKRNKAKGIKCTQTSDTSRVSGEWNRERYPDRPTTRKEDMKNTCILICSVFAEYKRILQIHATSKLNIYDSIV